MIRDIDIMDYVAEVLGNDCIYACDVEITIGRDVICANGLDSYAAALLVASAAQCASVDRIDFDSGARYGRVNCYRTSMDYERAMERYGVYFDDDTGEWVNRDGDMAYGTGDSGEIVLLVFNGGGR